MNTRISACLLFCAGMLISCSRENKPSLHDQLTNRLSSFNGEAGLYVQHLQSGETVSINADSVFPTASMVKIPIMIGMFAEIEKGKIEYHATLTYRDSLLYPGEDILGSFKDEEKISLSKVLMLMITTSDNTASLWCQQMAGGGAGINDWLERNGFVNTRVNSRTPGRERHREKYGWGQTTPREMAELLVQIRQGNVISPRASERMYRNLTRIYWDSEALSALPPFIQAASKQGAVDQSRSEVVLVHAPHGDYVFCLITKNQEDTSWTADNEGFALLRDVSRMLWNYFEPDYGWQPAAGSEEWY
jgi:beta-lactamase class A